MGVINRWDRFGVSQIVAASLTELAAGQVSFPTCRTTDFQLATALVTEAGVLLVLKLALRAFHPGASRKEVRWEWLGVLVLGSVLNSRKSR